MSEYAARRHRGRMVALVFSMQGAGLVVGPLIAIGLLSMGLSQDLTWRIMLALGAVPALAVFWLRRQIRETPRFLLAQMEAREAAERAARAREATGIRGVLAGRRLRRWLIGASLAWLLFGATYFFAEFGPNTTTFVYPAEIFPVRVRTTSHGIAAAAGKIGAFTGTYALTALLPAVGLGKVSALVAAVSVLGLLVTVTLLPEPKGASLEQLTEIDFSDNAVTRAAAGSPGARLSPRRTPARARPERKRSLEVRWILPGQPGDAVTGWFARFPARVESREDIYLVDPQPGAMSVKFRQGRALQLKVYRGSPGILEVAGRACGRMESWDKWSLPCDPSGVDGADMPGWRPVHKVIRRFSAANGQSMARTGGRSEEPRCEVELTEVRTGGQAWWTLGFEATGPDCQMREELEATAALVFAQPLPGDMELATVHSQSYVQWLNGGQAPSIPGI